MTSGGKGLHLKTGRSIPLAALVVCGAVVLLSSASPSLADDEGVRVTRLNTAYGPTGLISVPTAFVTPRGHAQVGAFYGRDMDTGTLNYGLIDGLEVGGAFLNPESDDDEVIANVKANIIPSNWKRVQIGVGMMDVFDSMEQTFYAVVSTDLLAPPREIADDAASVRVHVGYGAGFFDDELIGGAEVFLNNRWAVVGEWNGDDIGAAIRYAHSSPFRAQAGLFADRFFATMSFGLDF